MVDRSSTTCRRAVRQTQCYHSVMEAGTSWITKGVDTTSSDCSQRRGANAAGVSARWTSCPEMAPAARTGTGR